MVMAEDSLKDVIDRGDDSYIKRAIIERYGEMLKEEVIFGEPMDIKDVSTAYRTYDHGQASQRSVSEVGIRAVFDPERIQPSRLTDGDIRAQLQQMANSHFSGETKIDVIIGEDAYTIWLVDNS